MVLKYIVSHTHSTTLRECRNDKRAEHDKVFRWSRSILLSLDDVIHRVRNLAHGHFNCKIIWGRSYKTFYALGQIYKLVLKLDNML